MGRNGINRQKGCVIYMSSEYILDDVVEEFFDEDTLMSNIKNNPIKWIVSLSLILPGMIYTSQGYTEYSAAISDWGLPTNFEVILEILITGQLMIAPVSCYLFSRTGNVAPALLIAMAGSAILVSNPHEIARMSQGLGTPFALFCLAMTAPMIIVLKSKKKLLDPGKERMAWCSLLAISILMFSSATVVPSAGVALAELNCDEGAGALLNEFDFFAGTLDGCDAATFRYAPMLFIVAAIAWAWPRGKEIIGDIIDDIVEHAVDN